MKKKWFAGLILVGVWLFGLSVGVGGTLLAIKKNTPIHHPMEPRMLSGGPRKAEFVVRRLSMELDLTEEQKQLIFEEMKQASEAFSRIHGSVSDQMRDVIAEANEAVSSHLNDEQKIKYQEYLQKRERRVIRIKHSREEGRPHPMREHHGHGSPEE